MAYITIDDYKSIYGEIGEAEFNRFSYDAEKEVDRQTTGIDNVAKLKAYFPTNENDIEAIKRCVCALLHDMLTINSYEIGGDNKGVIASVSSGSESISYQNVVNVYQQATADAGVKHKIYLETINHYLRGVTDVNGVNVLYMGAYPYVRQNNNTI